MDKQTIIDLLNKDLQNEWKHLTFYLYHASAVKGLHREEYREFFLKEAAKEMGHVTAFSDLIWGLGGNPTSERSDFAKLEKIDTILLHALTMESEVVENYVQRIKDAEHLGGVDGKWLEIFLEKQVEESREDVDNLKQMLWLNKV